LESGFQKRAIRVTAVVLGGSGCGQGWWSGWAARLSVADGALQELEEEQAGAKFRTTTRVAGFYFSAGSFDPTEYRR